MDATTDTAIYLRISMDRTGEELGVTRQREDGRKLAEVRGWTIAREYTDNDVSASGRVRRPAFEEMLADIEAGKIKRVIAWDLTRLTRNMRDRVRILTVGKERGVTLALVRGSDMDLSTPAGRIVADLLSGIAQHETEVKAERQARAARQAAEQGRRVGGRRPFGYDADGRTIRQPEADALIEAYDAVLHGAPLAVVARELNGRGLSTSQSTRTYRHGCGEHGQPCLPDVKAKACPARVSTGQPSPWTGQTLRGVLLNPRYAGLRSLVTREQRTGVHPTRARLAGIVTGADGRPVPAEWPALVSEETWRAVVDVLTDESRAAAPRADMALLTGIAFCGVCGPGAGVTVHGGRQGRHRLEYRTYRCRAAYGHVIRKQEPIDAWIGALVVERLNRPDADDILRADDRPDAKTLKREAATLRRRLDTLAAALADEDITREQHRQQAGRLKARLAEVEQRQADAGRVDVLGPLIHAEDVAEAWTLTPTARQRIVVELLFSSIVIMPAAGRRGQRASASDADVLTIEAFPPAGSVE